MAPYETSTLRGSGRTMRQLRLAKLNALFVWCNNAVFYPKELAKKLNRPDIRIISPEGLHLERVLGNRFSEIILDHACELTESQQRAYEQSRQYINIYATKGPNESPTKG